VTTEDPARFEALLENVQRDVKVIAKGAVRDGTSMQGTVFDGDLLAAEQAQTITALPWPDQPSHRNPPAAAPHSSRTWGPYQDTSSDARTTRSSV